MSDMVSIDNLLMILLVAGILLFFVYKSKKRKEQETYTIAYAGYSEPADGASADLQAAFTDMLPADPTGKSLLRLSLLNRGERMLRQVDFHQPVTLRLPPDSRILDARAVQSTDRGLEVAAILVRIDHGNLEIAPFDLRGRSSVIFNILTEGPSEPFEIAGRFEGQTALESLS